MNIYLALLRLVPGSMLGKMSLQAFSLYGTQNLHPHGWSCKMWVKIGTCLEEQPELAGQGWFATNPTILCSISHLWGGHLSLRFVFCASDVPRLNTARLNLHLWDGHSWIPSARPGRQEGILLITPINKSFLAQLCWKVHGNASSRWHF